MIWRVTWFYIRSVFCVAVGSGVIGVLIGGVMGGLEGAVYGCAVLGAGMAIMCAPIYLVVIASWAVFSPRTFAKKFGPAECSSCGYDCTGLRGDRCPECGTMRGAAVVQGVEVVTAKSGPLRQSSGV
ncbi:MAG: hypothetical protein JNK58_12500 [Phycisphaerae bacterium]|nr:hypothetical protein [Phycisphaerae bacterium]